MSDDSQFLSSEKTCHLLVSVFNSKPAENFSVWIQYEDSKENKKQAELMAADMQNLIDLAAGLDADLLLLSQEQGAVRHARNQLRDDVLKENHGSTALMSGPFVALIASRTIAGLKQDLEAAETRARTLEMMVEAAGKPDA